MSAITSSFPIAELPVEDVPCILDGRITVVRLFSVLAAGGYVCTYDQDARAFRIAEAVLS